MKAIDPYRVQSLVETHLDNLIADIQKEFALSPPSWTWPHVMANRFPSGGSLRRAGSSL